jgi:hypothetical protein
MPAAYEWSYEPPTVIMELGRVDRTKRRNPYLGRKIETARKAMVRDLGRVFIMLYPSEW